MEALKEYLEKKKAHLITSLNDDNARKDDPILGRFLQGRAVIEEDYLKPKFIYGKENLPL